MNTPAITDPAGIASNSVAACVCVAGVYSGKLGQTTSEGAGAEQLANISGIARNSLLGIVDLSLNLLRARHDLGDFSRSAGRLALRVDREDDPHDREKDGHAQEELGAYAGEHGYALGATAAATAASICGGTTTGVTGTAAAAAASAWATISLPTL